MKKKTYLLMALTMVSMGMNAQNSGNSSFEKGIGEFTKTMTIGGTIRSKYEYQTEEGEGRFEVRTARINVTGNVTPQVSYKAEIDLCDEGKIKMLDAYTRIKPWKTLQFTIGQERVPFTIDAHRSPHQQYFANRSFIAKQVGNVRDVGAEIEFEIVDADEYIDTILYGNNEERENKTFKKLSREQKMAPQILQ